MTTQMHLLLDYMVSAPAARRRSLQPNLRNIARVIARDPKDHVTIHQIRLNSNLANCASAIQHIIQIIPVKTSQFIAAGRTHHIRPILRILRLGLQHHCVELPVPRQCHPRFLSAACFRSTLRQISKGATHGRETKRILSCKWGGAGRSRWHL
jgi:hypothetical protein